jgi:DNA repair and recombination protein RAD52
VTAVVKVMLKDGTYHEDVGYGMAEHPKKGSAIENAKKVLTSMLSRRRVIASNQAHSLTITTGGCIRCPQASAAIVW